MHKGGSLTDTEAAYIICKMFYPDRGMVTKSLVCIPKVFFIGFPRRTSTQLYQTLTRHPQFIGGANKEPHWWTRFPFIANSLTTFLQSSATWFRTCYQEYSCHLLHSW